MAIFALTNVFTSINAVNLSDHLRSSTLKLDVNDLNSTAFGSSWETFIAGLKSGSLALEFEDDFALSSVDSTLWNAFGTVVAFEVRPDAGSRSTTNPGYTGSVLVNQLTVGGQVGELAMKSLTFPTSGTVLRQTA